MSTKLKPYKGRGFKAKSGKPKDQAFHQNRIYTRRDNEVVCHLEKSLLFRITLPTKKDAINLIIDLQIEHRRHSGT